MPERWRYRKAKPWVEQELVATCVICGREFSYYVGHRRGIVNRKVCDRKKCKKRNHANNALKSLKNKIIRKLREEDERRGIHDIKVRR